MLEEAASPRVREKEEVSLQDGGRGRGRQSIQWVQRTSTTAPRYLSGGGSADPRPVCACEGVFDGSAVAMVVESEK